MNTKVLAGVLSLAVVAFLPHTSFAQAAQGARQAIKAGQKLAPAAASGQRIGGAAARATNLGAAAGAAGSIATGAQADAAAQSDASCNMSNLSKGQRRTVTAYYQKFGGNGGQAAACNAKIFENDDAAKNAVLIQDAALQNADDIAAGKVAGYVEQVERETGLTRGTLQQLCVQDCATVPKKACKGLAI